MAIILKTSIRSVYRIFRRPAVITLALVRARPKHYNMPPAILAILVVFQIAVALAAPGPLASCDFAACRLQFEIHRASVPVILDIYN
jgi:hypothetical protein